MAFFATPVGVCGVAWSARGLTAVQLPEAGTAATRARLRARCPQAVETEPPEDVQRAIDDIGELLRTGSTDLRSVALDYSQVGDFERRAYEVARGVLPGATSTYGEIAAALGDAHAARAVGQAMGHNPYPVVVPCHRVLAADGSLGGFSAGGGVETKLQLLRIEGAEAARQGSLFDG